MKVNIVVNHMTETRMEIKTEQMLVTEIGIETKTTNPIHLYSDSVK